MSIIDTAKLGAETFGLIVGKPVCLLLKAIRAPLNMVGNLILAFLVLANICLAGLLILEVTCNAIAGLCF